MQLLRSPDRSRRLQLLQQKARLNLESAANYETVAH